MGLAVTRTERIWLGAFLLVIGSAAQAVAAAMGKYVQESVSADQVVLAQNLVGLLICLPLLYFRGGWGAFRTGVIGTHLIRGMAGAFSWLFFFLSINKLSLVDAVLFINTGPLMIPIILWIWTRERMQGKIWWGVLIGFIGIIFVLHPSTAGFKPVMGLALLSGLGLAIAFVAVRILGHTERPVLILVYYFAVSSIVLLPFAIWNWQSIGAVQWAAMVVMGLFYVILQFALTYAFSYGRVSVLSPLIYLAVVWSGILDWIFWHDIPGWESLIGTTLVILGGVLSITMRSAHASGQELGRAKP